jgi:hypothetical protein
MVFKKDMKNGGKNMKDQNPVLHMIRFQGRLKFRINDIMKSIGITNYKFIKIQGKNHESRQNIHPGH